MFLRRFLLFLAFVGLLTPCAYTAYQIEVSTATIIGRQPVARRHSKHRMRHVRKQIESAIQKTSPNPRVQGSSRTGMPANSPPLPNLVAPPAAPPPSRADRFFAGAAKVMTKSWGPNIFVWLPAISTDPNSGPTYGILPVIVLADPQSHHIRHLIAPSLTYNSLFGVTGTGRYYFYPTDASQLYTAASLSEYVNRELKVRYENTSAEEGILYLRAESYYSADGSPHFYGIGPATHESDETGFTAKDTVVRGTIGINFSKAWRATFGERYREFETGPNIIPDVDDLAQHFSNVQGVGTSKTVASEFRLLWDTRDSPVTPSEGSSGELFTEKTSYAMGSNADYFRYGLEGRHLFPWKNPNQTTVIHGLYEQVNGPLIPFDELPSIGGRDTLRGFGDGRFVDRGRLVFNVEQRITFSSLSMMGIQTQFQLAPFFDLGTVFPSRSEIQRRLFYPVYGGAFRAVVKPNVVGDVEVGIGKEGPAVFVDINYPF
jgi:hypothetical protein